MHFLLEPDAFPNEPYLLAEAVDRAGLGAVTLKLGKSYEEYAEQYRHLMLVMHGSKQLAEAGRRASANWHIFWNEPQFECHYYFPRFGRRFLANEEYFFLPYGVLIEEREKVASCDGLFIKSNGFKDFSGVVCDSENFDRTMRNIGCYAEPETLCLVAPQISILQEWRLVIADGKVVTGCQYKPERAPMDDSIRAYAEHVLRIVQYNPDPIWVMDICEVENQGLRILETGPFSCCALYECDHDAIINALHRIVGD